jgi:hypothetical protein
MYFWIYETTAGRLVISRPFEDYFDCETEYVQTMERLKAGGVNLARLGHRGVHDGAQATEVVTDHMQKGWINAKG